MTRRLPTGTWWNQLSKDKRRKVILTINDNASFTFNVENNILFRWGALDRLLKSQIEIYREVDAELTYLEKRGDIPRVYTKHW